MVYVRSSVNSGGSSFPAISASSGSVTIRGKTYNAETCDHTVKVGTTTVHYSELEGGCVIVIPGAGAFTMAKGNTNSGTVNGVSYKSNGERVWINGKELKFGAASSEAHVQPAQNSPGLLARVTGWFS